MQTKISKINTIEDIIKLIVILLVLSCGFVLFSGNTYAQSPTPTPTTGVEGPEPAGSPTNGVRGTNASDSSATKFSNPSRGTVTLSNPLNVNSVGEALNKAVEIFSYLAILAAVCAFIFVGFKFVWAQGKPNELKEAGKWLGNIAIGVAIILGARLMISIIINTLEATGVVNEKVIESARTANGGQSK